MIIAGKALFKCPKTGKEVQLHKVCTNIDGKGKPCPFFKHWMWRGSRPLLACNYDAYNAYKKDVEKQSAGKDTSLL